MWESRDIYTGKTLADNYYAYWEGPEKQEQSIKKVVNLLKKKKHFTYSTTKFKHISRICEKSMTELCNLGIKY